MERKQIDGYETRSILAKLLEVRCHAIVEGYCYCIREYAIGQIRDVVIAILSEEGADGHEDIVIEALREVADELEKWTNWTGN